MFLPKDLKYYGGKSYTIAANTSEVFIVDIPSTARTLYSVALLQDVAGYARISFSIDNNLFIQNTDQSFFRRGNVVAYPTQPAPGRLYAQPCNPSSEFKLTIDNRSPGERTFVLVFTYLEYSVKVSPRMSVGFDRDIAVGTNNYKMQLPAICDKLISYNIGEQQFSIGDSVSLTINNDVVIDNVSPDFYTYGFVASQGDYMGYLNYPVSKNSNFFVTLTALAGTPGVNHVFYYK